MRMYLPRISRNPLERLLDIVPPLVLLGLLAPTPSARADCEEGLCISVTVNGPGGSASNSTSIDPYDPQSDPYDGGRQTGGLALGLNLTNDLSINVDADPRWHRKVEEYALDDVAKQGRDYGSRREMGPADVEPYQNQADVQGEVRGIEAAERVETPGRNPPNAGQNPATDRDISEASRENGDDPVDPGTGEYRERRGDLQLSGIGMPFRLERTYGSRYHRSGPLGFGWDHNYNQSIEAVQLPCGVEVLDWHAGDTSSARFEPDVAEVTIYRSRTYLDATLLKTGTGFVLTRPEGVKHHFDATGRLTRIADLTDNAIQIQWENVEDTWRVAQVEDTLGRQIRFEYDDRGFLHRVEIPSMGVAVHYEVDARGDLVRFVNSAGIQEGYAYAHSTDADEAYWPTDSIEQSCRKECGEADDLCQGKLCEQIAEQQRTACIEDCQGAPGGCNRMCGGECQQTCAREGDCRSACAESCDFHCKRVAVAACEEAFDEDYCWDGCKTLCDHTCDDEPCEFMCPNGEDCFVHGVEIVVWGVVETVEWIWCSVFSCAESRTRYDETREAATEFCHKSCNACCRYGQDCVDDTCLGQLAEQGKDCVQSCIAGFYHGTSEDTPEQCSSGRLKAGCVETALVTCRSKCQSDECAVTCDAGCADVCETECKQACADTTYCSTLCDIDYTSGCEQHCVDECVQTAAHHPSGLRTYGRPQELNHNLVAVTDGNGTVFLHNTYGDDVFAPDFDRVVSQRFGENQSSYAYYEVDDKGRVAVAAADAAWVSPQLQLEELCPIEHCSEGPANNDLRIDEALQQASQIPESLVDLLREKVSLPLTPKLEPIQAGPLVPTPRIPNWWAARHDLAEALRQRACIPPEVDLPVRPPVRPPELPTTEFPASSASWPSSSLTTSGETSPLMTLPEVEWSGMSDYLPPDALGAELLTESGSVLPMLPREHSSSPDATLPLAHHSDSLLHGKLPISGADLETIYDELSKLAKSLQDFPIAGIPKASIALLERALDGDESALRAVFRNPPPQSLASLDAMSAALQTVAEVRRAQWDAYRDHSRLLSELNGPDNARLLDELAQYIDDDIPCARNGFGEAPRSKECWEKLLNVAERRLRLQSPSDETRFCNIGPTRYGEAVTHPWPDGLKPIASVTVVRDGHGTVRTYQNDQAGRVVRKANHGTDAVVVRNYDPLGRLTAERGAFGDRICLEHEGDSRRVSRRLRLAAPGYPRADLSIGQRFEWQAFPERLEKIYLPQSDEVAVHLQWDERGLLQSRQTAEGMWEHYTYDERGRLTSIDRPDRGLMQLRYEDASGLWTHAVAHVQGEQPYVTRVEHDDFGRETRLETPQGRLQTWRYSPDGRLEQETVQRGPDAATVSSRYEYDAAGQLITAEISDDSPDASIVTHRYTYNTRGALETIQTETDAELRATCLLYDSRNQLVQSVQPGGMRTRYERDASGEITAVVAGQWEASGEGWDATCDESLDSEEHTLVVYERDPSGRVLRRQEPGVLAEEYRYDGFGRLIEIREEGRRLLRYAYDARDLLVEAYTFAPTAPFLEPDQWTPLAPPGGPWRGKPGMVAFASWNHDRDGRLSSTRELHFVNTDDGKRHFFEDVVSTIRHSADGRTAIVDQPVIGQTTLGWDDLGRPTVICLPIRYIGIAYADQGKQVTATTMTLDGTVTRERSFNASGQLLEDSIDGRNIYASTYDAHGRQVAVQTLESCTEYTYDALGRVNSTARTSACGDADIREYASHTYDNHGLLAAVQDGRGETTHYGYDVLGRLQLTTYPDESTKTQGYLGGTTRLAWTRERNGRSVLFEYEPESGRLAALHSGESSRIFRYDATGLRQAAVVGSDALEEGFSQHFTMTSLGELYETWSEWMPEKLVRRSYDAAGRRVATEVGGRLVTKELDSLGRTTAISLDGQNLAWVRRRNGLGQAKDLVYGNGLLELRAHNSLGYLTSVQLLGGMGVKHEAIYEWADSGQMTASTQMVAQDRYERSEYQPDPLGRLTYEGHQDQAVDGSGFGLLSQFGGARSYVYDDADNVSLWTDATGRSVSTHPGPDNRYARFDGSVEHDAAGRAERFSGLHLHYGDFGELTRVDVDAAESWSLQYDAFGQLVGIQRQGDAPVRLLLDSNGQILLRQRGSEQTLFVAGPDVLPIAAVDEETTAYLHYGSAGRVTATSNWLGEIATRYAYSAYGEPAAVDGAGQRMPLDDHANELVLMDGQPYVPALGLQRYGARWYRPAWGRFITPDPAGYADGLNMYAFAGNMPLAFHDPYGLWKVRATDGLLNALWELNALGLGFGTGLGLPMTVPGLVLQNHGTAFYGGQLVGATVGLAGDAALLAAGCVIAGGGEGLAVAAIAATPATAGASLAATAAGVEAAAMGTAIIGASAATATRVHGPAAVQALTHLAMEGNGPSSPDVNGPAVAPRGAQKLLTSGSWTTKATKLPEHGTFYADPKGNIIPTPKGGRIAGSPDGRFIQAKDAAGNATGVRIDGAHNPIKHPDIRAQGRHGHVPGVTNPDGTPWLPLR